MKFGDVIPSPVAPYVRCACAAAALLGVGLFAGSAASPHVAAEPASRPAALALTSAGVQDPDRWTTIAHGDEILHLAAQPDNNHILWSGTEGGGLVVWDLKRGEFEQFLRPNQPGMAGNQVFDIAFEAGGAAWLATEGGMSRVPAGRPVSSGWQAWSSEQGLPNAALHAVAIGADGRIWAGGPEAGLFVLSPGASRWDAVAPDPFQPGLGGTFDGPGARPVASLAVGRDGLLWVAHGRSSAEQPALSVFEPERGAWRHVAAIGPGDDPRGGPRSAGIIDVAVDPRDGSVWAATWARGLARLVNSAWQTYGEDDGLCGDTVVALTTDGGTLWAACGDTKSGYGAARWDGESWTTETDLETSRITTIAPAGDTVWLGSNGPGPSGEGILPVGGGEALTSRGAAPPANEITALAFADDGSAWVGTRSSGLGRWDAATDTWLHVTVNGTQGELAGDLITALVVHEDALWVGATKSLYREGRWLDGGISVLDARTGAVRRTIRPDGVRLPDGDIGSLVVDGNGQIWIGMGLAAGGPGISGTTHHGEGLIRHDPITDSWTRVSTADRRPGWVGDTIVGLAVQDDALWAAASFHHDANTGQRAGGGMLRGDLSAGSWRGWRGRENGLATFRGTGLPGSKEALVTGDMRSVHVDTEGRVWAGSFVAARPESLATTWPFVDAVVNEWDGARWLPRLFVGQGWVSSMSDDGAGRLWIGVTRGHAVAELTFWSGARIDAASGGVRILDGSDLISLVPPHDGLAGRGITAIARDPIHGAMWVGSENAGLSIYRSQGYWPPAPPTPRVSPTPRPEATDGPGPTRPPTLTPRAASATPTRSSAARGLIWLPITLARSRFQTMPPAR